jgi:hypothetical protein
VFVKPFWQLVSALLVFFGFLPGAFADDKQVCVDAYAKAQDLKDTSSLLAARESLRACSHATCTAFIVKDCTDWLAAVEREIPSVVFAVKTAAGEHVADVAVTTANSPSFRGSVDGRPRELDPGKYAFEFSSQDGRKAVVNAVVLNGQKNQLVVATLPAKSTVPAASAAPLASASAGASAATHPNDTSSANEPGFWNAQRTIGVVIASVGAVATVGGAVVGLSALSKHEDAKAHCPNDLCDDEGGRLSDDAKSLGNTSKILFIAGGALVAGGGIVFLLSPGERSSEQAMQVTVGPGTLRLLRRF